MRGGLLLVLLLVGCQAAEERQRDLLGQYLEKPERLTSVSLALSWGEATRKPVQAPAMQRTVQLRWDGEGGAARLGLLERLKPGEVLTIRAGETSREAVVAALQGLLDNGVLELPTVVTGGMPGEVPADAIRVRLAGDAGPFELNRVLPVPDKGVHARQRAALAELWEANYALVDAQVTIALRAFATRERALRQRIGILRRQLDDAEFEATQSGKVPPDMKQRTALLAVERALTTLRNLFTRRSGPVDPEDPGAGTRVVEQRELAALRDPAPLDRLSARLDAIAARIETP